MAPTAIPNIIAALTVKARTFTDLSLPTDPVRLCSEAGRPVPRIGGRVRNAPDDKNPWKMPTFAIVFRKVGGLGENPSSRLITDRIQADFYAKTAHEADRLWRVTHPFLVPEVGPGLPPAAFLAANTSVYWIMPQGSAYANPDPAGWPRVSCMYLVAYSVVAR